LHVFRRPLVDQIHGHLGSHKGSRRKFLPRNDLVRRYEMEWFHSATQPRVIRDCRIIDKPLFPEAGEGGYRVSLKIEQPLEQRAPSCCLRP
jgi:hypothetical protein